ncbi:ABC transporter permease subunit [Oculatella sp. LEGE 06141]|uniref:amino acid ABC transporter permease n=1 Tax=Oculatella sp. LEGE 06141 TaxID=1828648 RepID=UPI0018814073|nr:ABC transporter permease subunit [Oculatella sp. LEGE 06141]MBE9178306.1 ABC transporter permease subunit [Oculatella sp. LEGE 06141]
MTSPSDQKIPLWRDERFWRILLQALAVVGVIIAILIFAGNLSRNMQQRGIQFGFAFLRNPAGFSIGETLFPFLPNEPYFKALLAGILNTIRVLLVGIVLTTILGSAAGIASFSENWLLRQISRVYVEIVRNTPLLLQLFFWYFAVFFGLPAPQNQLEWFGSMYLSKAGVSIPWPQNTPYLWMWLAVLLVGAIAALFVWRQRVKLMVEQGASGRSQLTTLIAMGVIALLIVLFGLGWQIPESTAPGLVQGGLRLTLEFSALLAGLVFYTGGFIAEIVRAGIQSVSKGQWEAARSLGLQSGLVMRLVVFPQALRVILPALNSQYQNLAKNSSLGFAIAYPEVYSVANTTYNQTGRPVEVFLLLMAAFLLINLVITIVMNQLNRSVQLKER